MNAKFYKFFFLVIFVGMSKIGLAQGTVSFQSGFIPYDGLAADVQVGVGAKTANINYNNAVQANSNYYVADDGTGSSSSNLGLITNTPQTGDLLTVTYTDNSAFSFQEFKIIDFYSFYVIMDDPLTIKGYNGGTLVATMNFSYDQIGVDATNRNTVSTLSNNAAFGNVTKVEITGAFGLYHMFDDFVFATPTCTAPTIVGNPSNKSICPGNNTTFTVSATGATGYQWQVDQTGSGSYTDLTNTGTYSGVTGSTLTITGATAGMNGYRYRATAINGIATCFANSNYGTLNVSPVSGTTVVTNVACFGGNTGAINLTATGGSGSYTYNWGGGVTAEDRTGLAAGTYSVTITDSNGCTGTVSGITVTQPTAVVSGTTVVTNVACNGGNTGAINLTPSGGTPGYTFNWGDGATTEDRTGLLAGIYSVTITDANGCTGTVSGITVTQPPALTMNANAQTNVSCFGGSNGAASVNVATGGAGNYTYNWTPGNPTGDGTTSVTGLSAGTWICTVTDANSCTKAQSFTITAPPALAGLATASQTNVSCNGGSTGAASVTAATGGAGTITYDWTPGTPTGDGTTSVTGLSAGVYTVTATDANGCTRVQNFTVTQPPALAGLAAASQTNISCNGGSNGAASVTAATGGTGTITYDWTPGTPTGDGTISVTGLSAGVYTVTATDANGCTKAQSFTITAPPALTMTANTQTNVSCDGGSNGAASVNAAIGGAGTITYDWTPGTPTGDGTTSVTGLSAGVYTITATDANGCTKAQSFTITAPPALSFTAASQTNVSCDGGSNGAASVNAATGGAGSYTYNWTPGNPTGDGTTSITGLTAGTWTCTVTDANACTATQSFTITAPPALSFTAASQTNIACFGESNGAAAVNAASGGAGGYTYDWVPGTPTGDGTTSVTGLSAGTYTVTATDANGCTKTQSFTITAPPALSFTAASQTNISCFGGSNGSASVNVPTGGTPFYTYDWTPGTPTGDGTTSISGVSAGTWTCTVTDANGCTASQSFTITEPTQLVASAISQNNVSCNSGTNGSATVGVTGGTAGYTYSWSPSGGTASTASGLAAGTYTVTVTDANACQATQIFTITEPDALVPSEDSHTDVSCNGGTNGSATVAVTGGTGTYTYSWSPSGGTSAMATGLAAGTYTVTVTDANSCQATQNFTITQPTPVVATPVAQTNVACNGQSTGSASITASGGTAGYTYSWSPSGGTADTATGLQAGTYTVTVTDTNGCTANQSFTITEPDALVVSVGSQNNVSCNSGSNGSATVAVTGGATGYTYEWTPGNPTGDGTATISGISAGTYSVTVTDANACQATQTFTITQPDILVTSVTNQTNVSCNSGSNGSATVGVTGGTGSYTYFWSPTGGNSAAASGLSAGTYIVTVQDDNFCQTTQSVTITEPNTLVATPFAQTNVACNGQSTGSVTIIASGGTPDYTYSWSPSGGTAATATGLEADTYTVTVTDANGCTASQSFTITEPTPLVATPVGQSNLSCNGGSNGSASITASGGTGAYTYLWSPSGGTSASASGLAAGTYTVEITDANGCTVSESFIITQPDILSTSVTSQTNVSCNGGSNASATVGVTGGTGTYTYSWSPSGGTSASASGLAAGTYTVTIEDANLCQITQIVNITQPDLLVASVGSQTNVSCNSGSNGTATVAVTGGTGSYTYSWSPSGGTSATASGLSAGTYIVTVQDDNFCQTTQSVTITEPDTLVVTANTQTNVACHGANTGSATVNVTGGTADYTYSWSPSGGTASTATGLSEGTYIVTVTDANGCFASQSFTITEPGTAVELSELSNTDVTCNGGNNGSASVNMATGGVGAYIYDWTPGTPSGDGTTSVTGLSAGTWTCTATDENGCSASQSFTITEPEQLVVTAEDQTDVTCFGGSNGSATVAVTGGTETYTYEWSPSGGTSATATGLSEGTYTVTVTDANGCTGSQSFTIMEPAQLVATADTQTNVSCFGSSDGSATVAVTGGTGTYTYSWSPSGGAAATATGLAEGTYTVDITDANGCTASQSFTIMEPEQLVITADGQTNVSCFGSSDGSASVAVTGGTGTYTYDWSPSGGTAATATGLAEGTYTVNITDANGCTGSQSFTIMEPAQLEVNADSQTNVSCFGGSNGSASVAVTGGTGTYTYEWSPSGGTAATATDLAEGTYTVVVTDANGCTGSQLFTIAEPNQLVVTPGSQTDVSCFSGSNGSASVVATGGTGTYTYEWSPSGGTLATATGLAEGTYTVDVTDANGCTASQSFTISEPALLAFSAISHVDVLCNGASNGSAEVTVIGGTAPYIYEWLPSGGNNATASNLVAGTYTVNVTDANGCSISEEVIIAEPLAITIDVQPADVTTITGDDTQFSAMATNADSYQWMVSEDGENWTDVTDGGTAPIYSGATTNTLTLDNVPATFNGRLYRLGLTNGTACSTLSDVAELTISNILEAVDDDFSATIILEGTGGIAGDVTVNDLFNSQPVIDSDITTTIVDNDGLTGLTVDSDGNLIVPATAAEGTYTITYKICDVISESNCSTAEAIVVISPVAGIDKVKDISFTVYPNPASSIVYIKLSDFSVNTNLKAIMYDLNGRLIREDNINAETFSIDISGLESAVYILNITSDTGKATKRIVVDKKP